MAKKVLITPRSFGKIDNTPFEILKKYNYEIIKKEDGQKFTESEIIDIIHDIDGIIVGLDTINENILNAANKLKVITKYGVGLDNIDLDAAKRLGIKVTFTPGANTESVADFAFALLLTLSRSVNKLDCLVREKRWGKVIGSEIYGKTIGVIGTGAIGMGVAKRATGFGMRILGYDIYPNNKVADEIGMKYVDKKTILKESDFISLHVPLNKEMYHFIDSEELNLMKKTAILINTSRGGIVNEESLYHALKSKQIAGAALDVFEEEPPINNKLLELENVLLSPHCGASTTEATNRMGIMAAEGLVSILEDFDPKYLWE